MGMGYNDAHLLASTTQTCLQQTRTHASQVMGTGQHPRLSFDVRECVLPPVPLGITSRATFAILNAGYDNLELRFRWGGATFTLPNT